MGKIVSYNDLIQIYLFILKRQGMVTYFYF